MKFGTGKKTLRLSLGRFPGKKTKGGMTDLSSADVEGDYIPIDSRLDGVRIGGDQNLCPT